MRKADSGKKKGDRIGEKQRSDPPSFSLQIWTGGARRLKRELNIAQFWGERPEPCRLFAINFFWKPLFPLFLFIVDQPVRRRERERARK